MLDRPTKWDNNHQEVYMTATRTTAVTVCLGNALAEQLTSQARLKGTTSADLSLCNAVGL